MCGRYGRRSDKQRIAETFHAAVDLSELYLAPNDDISPGTFQPVVRVNDEGQRSLEAMYWGFKLPTRFVFNARSDSLLKNGLWKAAFEERRCIVPADSFFEWVRIHKRDNPKYEITVPGREPFGMAGSGAFGRTTRKAPGCPLSQSSPQNHTRVWLRSMIVSLPSLSPESMRNGWHHLNVHPCTCCVSCPQKRWTFG